VTANSAEYSRFAVAVDSPAACERYSGRKATAPLYANEKAIVTITNAASRRSSNNAR